MLFNSYAFLLAFLPAAILVCRIVDPHPRARIPALIALSLAFYAYWDWRFLALLIPSIVINWWAAKLYLATRRGGVVTVAIAANLAVLAAFKYPAFIADNLAFATGVDFGHVGAVLPLGISFFTFHHIMYLVDLRRGRAPEYPLDRYALYICYFPQVLSGPLVRWNEVMHQFGREIFTPGWQRRCAAGAMFVVLGLAQKVFLGDPLGRIIDPIYEQALAGALPDGRAWIGLAFAFQVFFDFAGYSDVAIGLALILGVQLPRNFDAPFRASSIQEFWQSWHMTLARFLRDYVFFPLAYSGIGGREHRVTRQLVAILITMALCGLWHGAAWHFVLWGTLQGVALIWGAVWRRYLPSPGLVLGWAATVGFFVFTIVFFRGATLDAIWRIYEGLLIPPFGVTTREWRIIALAVFVAVVLPPSHEIVRRLTEKPRAIVALGLSALAVAVLVQIGRGENDEFIYFQF